MGSEEALIALTGTLVTVGVMSDVAHRSLRLEKPRRSKMNLLK